MKITVTQQYPSTRETNVAYYKAAFVLEFSASLIEDAECAAAELLRVARLALGERRQTSPGVVTRDQVRHCEVGGPE